MNLIHKFKILIRRSQVAQSNCDIAIAKLSLQSSALQKEIEDSVSQIKGLQQLLLSLMVTKEVMSGSQMFMILRKQSSLRYQLDDLNLHISLLMEKNQSLIEALNEQQLLRAFWYRNEKKYQRGASIQQHQLQLCRLRFDEAEQEDRVKWKNDYS